MNEVWACQRGGFNEGGRMCRAAVDPAAMPNGVTERAEWLLLVYCSTTAGCIPSMTRSQHGSIDLIKRLNTGGQAAAGLA